MDSSRRESGNTALLRKCEWVVLYGSTCIKLVQSVYGMGQGTNRLLVSSCCTTAVFISYMSRLLADETDQYDAVYLQQVIAGVAVGVGPHASKDARKM